MSFRFSLLACNVVGLLSLTAVAATPDLDVILYGADGCVGHWAARYLSEQPGLRWAVAGRTEAHLIALVDQLTNASSKPEIIVAPLNKTADAKPWVGRARAIISAAGPFSKNHGEVIVQACAELGVNYSDTSDEFYWQREMIDRYDAAAQASGASIVFAGGFCATAGDLGTQLALAAVGVAEDAAEASVDAWLETYNGGASAGVANTAKNLKNASYPKAWDTDPYVLAPGVDPALKVDTLVEGMHFPHFTLHEGLLVANIFGPYDARLMRRTFAQRGQKVHLRVGAPSSMYRDWAAFLAVRPGSWKTLTTCPTEQIYEEGSWAYRFEASAGSRSKTLLLSGRGDPGYSFTAKGLAEAGLCLAGKTPGCIRKGAKAGMHAPLGVMDAEVMRQRLEDAGLLKVSEASEITETITV